MYKNLANIRIGEVKKNNFGSLMEIVEYRNNKNVTVKFLNTNNTVIVHYINFRNGQVSNPLDRTVYGVGYPGEGKYKPSKNGNDSPQYSAWHSMLSRCHDINFIIKNPTYKNCTVCEEWHDFQNFAKWYDENYYKIEGERMCLDKDILVKGNKVYSPETCVFVPHSINSLFNNNKTKRGNFPVGVSFLRKSKSYVARCGHSGKNLKSHKTVEEAFNAYKIYKENYIKEVAENYKEKIPNKLFEVMMNYIVEITD